MPYSQNTSAILKTKSCFNVLPFRYTHHVLGQQLWPLPSWRTKHLHLCLRRLPRPLRNHRCPNWIQQCIGSINYVFVQLCWQTKPPFLPCASPSEVLSYSSYSLHQCLHIDMSLKPILRDKYENVIETITWIQTFFYKVTCSQLQMFRICSFNTY